MSQEIAKSKGAVILEKLRKGLDCSRETHFPGQPDFALQLVPLSCDALQVSHAAAERRFKDIDLTLNILNGDDFTSELHVQVLSRSIRSAEDRAVQLFPDANELRELLTADERTALTSEYIDLQEAANPMPSSMPEEQFEEIEQLVKKKDPNLLSSIGSRMLASYIITSEGQRQN